MGVISKEYFDKILLELETTEGIILDKDIVIYCIENYYNQYVPVNFKTCKNDIVCISKTENGFKLVRLPMHRYQINKEYDKRIDTMDVILTAESSKILEAQDKNEIVYR